MSHPTQGNQRAGDRFGRRELFRRSTLAGVGAVVGARHLLAAPAEGERWVESHLKRMTPAERVGQLLIVHAHVKRLDRLVAARQVGAIYVPRGLPSPKDAVAFVNEHVNPHGKTSGPPLFMIGGTEAGAGVIAQGATWLPSNMAIGATGSEELAFQAGSVTALECRAMGIPWPGGTCVDVNTNPANPIINTRSFGDSPESVARLSAAWVRGMTSQQAVTWAYHFPGHGDTGQDSHLVVPTVDRSREDLERIDLAPFGAAIEAGLKSIATAHVWYPALEPTKDLPATLSKHILTDLLRKRMGFQGLIATDSFAMKAIRDNFGLEEAVVTAFRAGADAILAYPDTERCHQALHKAVAAEPALHDQLNQSVRRMLRLKYWAGLSRPSVIDAAESVARVGCAEHRNLALDIARKAITVVKGEAFLKTLPGRSGVLFVVNKARRPRTGRLAHEEFLSLLKARFPESTCLLTDTKPTTDEQRTIVEKAAESEAVVVICFTKVRSSDPSSVRLLPEQVGFLKRVFRLRPTGIFCFGNPYLLCDLGTAAALVCGYDSASCLLQAGVELLAGEITAQGKSPVRLRLT